MMGLLHKLNYTDHLNHSMYQYNQHSKFEEHTKMSFYKRLFLQHMLIVFQLLSTIGVLSFENLSLYRHGMFQHQLLAILDYLAGLV